MADINDRLDALEITVSHQEEQLSDLSEMVSGQWKLIEKLGGLLTKADARIESLENNNSVDGPGPLDEKPPHY
ncbi:MAG: SlyX family protein [Emcibacteraceae bacterium]|nr:SlyX family protein [Emcibacteraceae bacterium]